MLLDFDRLGSLRWVLIAIGSAVGLFLLLPILFIVALSFGDSQWLIFPPPGWTLEWYRQLFTESGWVDALLTSAKLAVIVTILSVGLGLLASLALVRGTFRGRSAAQAFFLTPMVLPVVVLAVALYAFSLRVGLNGTTTGFVIGHLVIALPFSIISISNSLASFDTSLEDAALICGASPLAVKLRVTLPAIHLGIFCGRYLFVPGFLGRSRCIDFHVEPDAADLTRAYLVDVTARPDTGCCCSVNAACRADDVLNARGCGFAPSPFNEVRNEP